MKCPISLAYLIFVSQVSCTNHRPPEPIEPHQSQWENAAISSYEYFIVHLGAYQRSPPMHVVIRDGRVALAERPCIPPQTINACKEYEKSWLRKRGGGELISHAKTIPQLFEELQRIRVKADEQEARFQVTFDPTYGYPTRFYFDDPNSDDEEFGFLISQFKVIE